MQRGLRLVRLALVVPLAPSSSACIAYEHQVDAEVHDPKQVWIENESTRVRLEPRRADEETKFPGIAATIERSADGSLEVDHHTFVRTSGTLVRPPSTLDTVHSHGDLVRIPIVLRRQAATNLALVTPRSNVRLLREREKPLWFIGVTELLLGAGGEISPLPISITSPVTKICFASSNTATALPASTDSAKTSRMRKR